MRHICNENGCRILKDAEVVLIKSRFMRNIFDQNTYVVLGERDALIIDAGAEVEDEISAVAGKNVAGILMTHLHFDHIWNLKKYAEAFDCPIFIKQNEEGRLLDAGQNASYMIRKEIKIDIPSERLKYYDDKLELGEFFVEVFDTPGHSADSVCLKIDDNLFTGDTVFNGNVGRFDFADSSLDNLQKSLEKILKIDYTTAYPGHYTQATKAEIDKTIREFLGK